MAWLSCRRLTREPSAAISFAKKLIREPVDKERPEYTLRPSTQSPADPRHRQSLPIVHKKTFKRSLLSCTKGGWCAPEPPKTLLIAGVSSGITSEAAMLAQLEGALQKEGLQVQRIQLLPSKRLASVHFISGFEAWEVYCQIERNNPSNLRASLDVDGVEFKRQEREQEREQSRMNNNRERDSFGDSSRHFERQKPTPNQRTCNPFVPCVTIPFEEYDRLPFSRRFDARTVISSIFLNKVSIEPGSTSWHVHFGREIDVIEADKRLQVDTFEFDGHKFYFERWKLVKDGRSWHIPLKAEPVFKSDPIPAIVASSPLKSLPIEDVDLKEVVSHLPKFVKKRPTEEKEDKNGKISKVEEATDLPMEHLRVESSPTSIKASSKEAESSTSSKPEPSPAIMNPSKPEPSTPIKATSKIEPSTTTATKITPNKTVKPVLLPKKTRGRPKKQDVTVSIDVGEEDPLFEKTLCSGCARTEGFFKLTSPEKERVKFPEMLEAFSSNSNPTNTSASASQGRSSRALNRRPLMFSTAPAAVLDLFKVSPLQSAQKLVSLRNSSIHSYGLVILEPADSGDLIIEYVGELVRASVANVRELQYEREHRGDGIASSYLFRLDDVMVIDATKKGSMARFINHSCDPNCVAKTITLNGSKRIVMYAKKALKAGDELTYDYKFPMEKDPSKRVKCLCGSSICRKFLN